MENNVPIYYDTLKGVVQKIENEKRIEISEKNYSCIG
jgi:hypothetical protein